MLVTLVVVAVGSTLASLALAVVVGARWRRATPDRAFALALAGSVAVGEVVARAFGLPSRPVLVAEAVLVVAAAAVARLRRAWNPAGVWFFANLVVASVAYLAYAGRLTVAGGLPPAGVAFSALLWALEAAGLFLAASFAFEICDVVCRVRGDRPLPGYDERYRPFVSLHVAAYNEPPDMLIETIRSLEALDYPDLEVVVVDNNTEHAEVWKPVEEYCADRPWVRFVHVAPWPGYKAGALNLALAEYTDPRAEVIGVVDADYLVDPDWLADLVGWFADPGVGFVQTPQDYGDWEGDHYLTACHDAYAYFFATTMRSRNERDSPIFGGTMGLIRRRALDDAGGWDEWCITEDAEASLRLLADGYSGVYIHESYGKGIMPLTFDALKRQRFRWCFGGIQILRKHARRLVPWQRRPVDRLSAAQRVDFLVGGLQWGTDLVNLGCAAVLVATVLAAAAGHTVAVRPLGGPAVVLPLVLATTGTLRAAWALRATVGIGARRAALAVAVWLALSPTVAYATLRGLARRDGVFLRTPKWRTGGGLVDALRSTVGESVAAAGFLAVAALAVASGAGWPLAALAAWHAVTLAAAPGLAWLNQHCELSARLERRRRTEDRRERTAVATPRLAGVAAVAFGACVLAGIGGLAALAPEGLGSSSNAFQLPEREPGDRGPVAGLVLPDAAPSGANATPTTTTSVPPAATAGPVTTSSPSDRPGTTVEARPTTTTTASPTTTVAPGPPSTVPAPPGTPPTSTGRPTTTTTERTPGPPASHPGNGNGNGSG